MSGRFLSGGWAHRQLGIGKLQGDEDVKTEIVHTITRTADVREELDAVTRSRCVADGFGRDGIQDARRRRSFRLSFERKPAVRECVVPEAIVESVSDPQAEELLRRVAARIARDRP